MKVNIKSTNFVLTPAIKDYIDKKLVKIENIVDRHEEEVLTSVEVGKTTKHHLRGDVYRAEIQLYFLGKKLRAVAQEEDIFAAIDKAKDQIEREVKGRKNREGTLLKKGGRAIKYILRRIRR